MELCITAYWSELKDVSLDLKMNFRGIQPSTTALVFVSIFYIHIQMLFSSDRHHNYIPQALFS